MARMEAANEELEDSDDTDSKVVQTDGCRFLAGGCLREIHLESHAESPFREYS